MIIKKFKADTETDAILQAKDELGKDAVVMNIKTITPKGIFKFFRKQVVEVTAAVDENVQYRPKAVGDTGSFAPVRTAVMPSAGEEVSAIEKKLNDLQGLLEKQINDAKIRERREGAKGRLNEGAFELDEKLSDNIDDNESDNRENVEKAGAEEKKEKKSRLNACMQLIYRQLLNNEVEEKYVNELTSEIETSIKKDAQLDRILAAVYQKLVLKLGQPSLIELTPGKTKYVFFLGPTGVGKTTTIAKIASSFKLDKKDVGLLTADTYRIAAVEQLRTYANILGVPLSIVYSASEILDLKKDLDRHDLVLIDTAGRSDKNKEQVDELKRFIDTIPEENREVYLVLSATTKYRDLVRIAGAYEDLAKYKLIFTKIDETGTIGNLYNILMQTKAPLSYVTFGQNVPDDIGKADTQSIAKQLLS